MVREWKIFRLKNGGRFLVVMHVTDVFHWLIDKRHRTLIFSCWNETFNTGSSITSSLCVQGKMCLRNFHLCLWYFVLIFFVCNVNICCGVYAIRLPIITAQLWAQKCVCWIKVGTLMIYASWMLIMEAPRVVNGRIAIEWQNSMYKRANTTMTDLHA